MMTMLFFKPDRLACVLTGLLFALASEVSWADCYLSKPAVTVTVNVPDSLNIPRDAPDGAEIYRSNDISLSGAPTYTCDNNNPTGYSSSVGSTSDSGPSPIGTSGIGWRLVQDDNLVLPYGKAQLTNSGTTYTLKTASIRLYKLGNASTVNAGVLGAYMAGSGNRVIYRIALSNAIVPKVSSCQTPSITVPLGKQYSSKFGDHGSTIGETAFSIKLKNCPAGLSSIDYQLDPAKTYDFKNGVMVLDSGGAEGVGIQITNDRGDPVALRARHNFLNNVSAGNHIIPFKAAYYKISSTVVGGAANGSMQFTIFYQ